MGDASYGGVDPDGSLWEVYVPAPEPALTGAWLVGFALLAGLAIITFGLIGFGVLFA